MQLPIFKSFIKNVISEGNRLQKVNINGDKLTGSRFTQTQLISIILSIGMLFLIKTGYSDNFAGYVISFLSILLVYFLQL